MKSLIKNFLLNRFMALKIVKTLLRLDSRLRSLINFFAIAVEGGIHPKHRIMNYHKFFVDNVSENDIVLDIGCGNGALTYDLAKKAKYVYAIDINATNIKSAKQKYGASNITYLIGDATVYNFNHKFDIIVLSNVLEHIENRVAFLKRLSAMADKLLIRVPMINRDWVVLYKKELGLPYYSDTTHHTEYTLDTLIAELSQANLKIEKYSIQFGEIWAVATCKSIC